jgi:hypothetical protein
LLNASLDWVTAAMSFSQLPIELNEHIAYYLDTDQALCAFASVCRATHAAVNAASSGLWKKCFNEVYDPTEDHSSRTLKKKYQARRHMAHRCTKFMKGNTKDEMRCLHILRDLINGSLPSLNPRRLPSTSLIFE